MKLESKEIIRMYRMMLKIRRFEEKAIRLYAKGLIKGSIHPCIGQEAIAVGACKVLDEKDYIVSTHRGHGHCIAKGEDPKKIMAELLGKATGCCGGKGGPMHLSSPKKGILGTSGIVGGGIPIAVGAALAIKLKGANQIILCFFGEGAINTGSFHEAVNLSSIWQLPVIFICENNIYGLSTPISEAIAIKNISDRALAYGISGAQVDGNDVLAVYDAVNEAVKKARSSHMPTLIEAKTYRIEGHYYGEADNYRTREEITEWQKKDPINRLRQYLIRDKILNNGALHNLEREIAGELDEAERFALNSPEPEPDTVSRNVYV